MPDAVDMAVEIEAEHLARGLARVTAPIAPGVAGECDGCGEMMPRLVDGRCGFCRDGRLPPPGWSPPAFTQPPARKVPTMPAKSIQLPASAASAISALERHAASSDLPLGQAAADLIARGAAAIELPPAAMLPTLDQIHLDALLAEVARRFEQAASPHVVDEAEARAAAAVARAEAAEEKLARVQAAVA